MVNANKEALESTGLFGIELVRKGNKYYKNVIFPEFVVFNFKDSKGNSNYKVLKRKKLFNKNIESKNPNAGFKAEYEEVSRIGSKQLLPYILPLNQLEEAAKGTMPEDIDLGLTPEDFDERFGTPETKGNEISSNAKGLAGALTNPTELAKSKGNIKESYPVEFRGKTYKDAEAAYQALKSTATKDEGPNSTYNLMVEIIKAKLQQHPSLVKQITEKGGSKWILASTHQPTNQNTVWETKGKNWFIKALNDAYIKVNKEASNKPPVSKPTVKDGFIITYKGNQYKVSEQAYINAIRKLNLSDVFKNYLSKINNTKPVNDVIKSYINDFSLLNKLPQNIIEIIEKGAYFVETDFQNVDDLKPYVASEEKTTTTLDYKTMSQKELESIFEKHKDKLASKYKINNLLDFYASVRNSAYSNEVIQMMLDSCI